MNKKEKLILEEIKVELQKTQLKIKYLQEKEDSNLLNIPNSFQTKQSTAVVNEVILKESFEWIEEILEQLEEIE